MIVSANITNQAYIFLCAVLGGVLIGLLYDLFRIRRKALRAGMLLIFIEDLFYWILVSLIIFGVAYYSNEGELRGFIFLGAAIGIILYILLLSRLVIGSAMLAIKVTCKILSIIWNMLVYPFKILYMIFRIPIKFAIKITGRFLRRVKYFFKNIVGRTFSLKRVIRNITKKT